MLQILKSDIAAGRWPMTLKLYCYGESGNAYKAARALDTRWSIARLPGWRHPHELMPGSSADRA